MPSAKIINASTCPPRPSELCLLPLLLLLLLSPSAVPLAQAAVRGHLPLTQVAVEGDARSPSGAEFLENFADASQFTSTCSLRAVQQANQI